MTNTKMNKSTPEIANTKSEPAKAEVASKAKPKLTAAYVKEMVAKGLSPLTGKPIRHYSRDGKRYAGKADAAKPVTEKVEAKVVAKPETKTATKASIPVLKAKKTVKKA